ncbi:hypothetical protein JCM19992_19780 [Thermostilla marina]
MNGRRIRTTRAISAVRRIVVPIVFVLAWGIAADGPVPSPDALRANEPSASGETNDVSSSELAERERRLAEQYRRFELLLARLSETTQLTDPERASLLEKARAESRRRLIRERLDEIAAKLEQGDLSTAIENQEEVGARLKELLEILEQGNRSDTQQARREAIKQLLRDIGEILGEQRRLYAKTFSDPDTHSLGKPQGDIARRTGELAKRAEAQAGDDAERSGESSPSDEPEKDGSKTPSSQDDHEPQSSSEPPSQARPDSRAESSENDRNSSQSQKGQENAQSGDGNSSQNQEQGNSGNTEGASEHSPPSGQSSESSTPHTPGTESGSQSQSPAGKALEQAQQRMWEAQRALEEARREGAQAKQEEAMRKLEEAKAELERILRQMREEEIGRLLTMLDVRIRRMLAMQREVYDATKTLDQVPLDERTRSDALEASRLGTRESEIVLEADRTLLVLKDDGTAVAVPEALRQARDDMKEVAERLTRADVGKLTQSIEEDIILGLEELLQAIAEAKKELEENRQQPQQSGEASGEMEQPLVDLIAELRVIRNLQVRINRRTEALLDLLPAPPQEPSEDLKDALKELSDREATVESITRELMKRAKQ